MSVSCHITLPSPARVRDVAKVIGLAAGVPSHIETLQSGATYSKVPGVSIQPTGDASSCYIKWVPSVSRDPGMAWYSFEFGSHGKRGIIGGSTAFWIVMGHRLVDVFGGEVDYVDTDDVLANYKRSTNKDMKAEDGVAWRRFQQAITDTKPITEDELKAANVHAAYKLEDE